MLGDGYIFRYILSWLRRHGFYRDKKDNWWIRNLAEKAMTENIEAWTAARIAAVKIAVSRQPWRLPELCDPETINMMEKLGVRLNADKEYIYARTVQYIIDKLLYHHGILPSEKHYLYNEAMKYMEKFINEEPWIVARRAAAVVFILSGKRFYLNWFHRATGIKLSRKIIRETEDMMKKPFPSENKLLVKTDNIIENNIDRHLFIDDEKAIQCRPEDIVKKRKDPENLLYTSNTLEDYKNLKHHKNEDELNTLLMAENPSRKPPHIEDGGRGHKKSNENYPDNHIRVSENHVFRNGNIENTSDQQNSEHNHKRLEDTAFIRDNPQDIKLEHYKPENSRSRHSILEDPCHNRLSPEDNTRTHLNHENDCFKTQVYRRDGEDAFGLQGGNADIYNIPRKSENTTKNQQVIEDSLNTQSLIWDYKNGEIVNPETGEVLGRIYDYGPTLSYLREKGILPEK